MLPRLPFRRRIYLVKHGFQVRFAAYPLVLLAGFLGVAGVFLYRYLNERLRLLAYFSHSRLDNPWDLVAPAVGQVVTWGGTAFLVALAGWGWVRFRRLHRDLEAVSDWLAERTRLADAADPPALAEAEVRALARSLAQATRTFAEWEREVGVAAARAVAAAEIHGPDSVEAVASLGALREAVGRVRVDEGLS